VENFNATEGSVTLIGAVSPAASDFSEPVTMHTKRFVRCFWALERSLAYARHFPSIHWLTSYSEYINDMKGWYSSHFLHCRAQILQILNEESEVMEIVKLIGADSLPEKQQLILLMGRVARLGFLQQNAYHARDTYMPFDRQLKLMELIVRLYSVCRKLIRAGISAKTLNTYDVFDRLIACKHDYQEMDAAHGYIDGFYHEAAHGI
jgi:V/A-type H+-transporting ATPase subunit A